jgi:tetratricopeptide (TPR) repeat protein
MKRYNESLEAYDKAIELAAENNTEELAQTWFSKASALNKTGRMEEATDAFQRSLKLYDEAIAENPGDVSLLEAKGRVLFNLERYDEAIAIYDHILETAPSVEPRLTQITTWIARGDALRALGRNEEALEAYDKAIEHSPMYGDAWYGRGEAQRALGLVQDAYESAYVAEKLGYQE